MKLRLGLLDMEMRQPTSVRLEALVKIAFQNTDRIRIYLKFTLKAFCGTSEVAKWCTCGHKAVELLKTYLLNVEASFVAQVINIKKTSNAL